MAKHKDRGDGQGKRPSVMGYFREIFRDRPALLFSRSNEEIFKQWLIDHPEHKDVPESVRSNLANLKCLLRKKSNGSTDGSRDGGARFSSDGSARSRLERLEMAIDDAFSLAKAIERDSGDQNGLEGVINLLRRARNEVVLKLG